MKTRPVLYLGNPDGSRYPMYDWCLFQPGHPLTPRPHQARPEKTRPHQSKPGYPGQQSLFRLDFNPKIIFYFFRLLQFPQSNFPFVGAYYLSRSGDVKCFINHFAPATCRTASVSSQKRFIDSQQIGIGIEKLWVRHASGGWATTMKYFEGR